MNSSVSVSYSATTSLKFCNINDDKALEIAEKVKANSTLKDLSIIGPFNSNYEGLSKIGGIAILKVVEMHDSIQSLNLEGNNGMGDDIAPAIGEMLTKNTSLLSLNLRDCGLHDASLEILIAALKVNKTLKNLEIDTNFFSELGSKKLRNAARERIVPLSIF